MAKYSYEFKMEVVTAYLNGEGGYRFLAKKFNIPHMSIVENWIKNYKTFGDEGLMRSRKNQHYSFEKKLSVVELYLTNVISYRDLAIQEGITNSGIIANWVTLYRTAGPDALRPRKKGRKKTMHNTDIDNKIQGDEERHVDTSAKYVKELEDELLKLRIENAFLKEARRLRLEDEARMRERRSSSTASEENSN